MKKWSLISAVLVLLFFAVSSSHFQGQQEKGNVSYPHANKGRIPEKTAVKIDNDYGKMPLFFIPNHGQMDKKVYYYVQGKDKTVYFTSEGITYSLISQSESSKPGPGSPGSRSKQEFPWDQRLRDSV